MPRRDDYVMLVVVPEPRYIAVSAADIVRTRRVPLGVAVRWQKVRREMTPAGLTRKLKDLAN